MNFKQIETAIIGGLGNVGISTFTEIMNLDRATVFFDIKSKSNQKKAKKLLRKHPKLLEVYWGDITQYDDIKRFFELYVGIKHVIHLAAIIPPLAYQKPELTYLVNVEGTKMLVGVLEKLSSPPTLLYTSSVAVYGDRLLDNYINISDPVKPNQGDNYAESKVEAENIIKNSSIKYLIFRLSFITSLNLKMDPLMFNVPLDTSIEILDTRDVGFALAKATINPDIKTGVYHLAGGLRSRTTYREFVNKMMKLFGFGKNPFPEEAFAKNNFSCGFMETTKSEYYLEYQRITLEEFYSQVKVKYRIIRWIVSSLRTIILPFFTQSLLKQSPFYHETLSAKIGSKNISDRRKPLANIIQLEQESEYTHPTVTKSD